MITGTLKSSIDLTPLVGLLLALTTVILCISPAAQSASKLDTPPISYPSGSFPPVPEPWFVAINAAGEIRAANGEDAPMTVTREQLLTLVPAGETIRLRAEADTPYGQYAELLFFLDAEGRDVAVVNEDLR